MSGRCCRTASNSRVSSALVRPAMLPPMISGWCSRSRPCRSSSTYRAAPRKLPPRVILAITVRSPSGARVVPRTSARTVPRNRVTSSRASRTSGRARLATALGHAPRDGIDVGREAAERVVRLAVDLGYRTHRPTRRQRPREHRLTHVRREADPEVARDLGELVPLALRSAGRERWRHGDEDERVAVIAASLRAGRRHRTTCASWLQGYSKLVPGRSVSRASL